MRWLSLAVFAMLLTGCGQSTPPAQVQAPKEEKRAPRRGYSGPKRDGGMRSLTLSCVAFSPDGKRVLTGYDHGPSYSSERPNQLGVVLRLWDIEGRRLLRTLRGQRAETRLVAFLPGGERAISVAGSVVRIWDLRSGEITRQFRMWERECSAVALTPDGKAILSQGADKDRSLRLALHEIPSGKLLARYDNRRRLNSIAFSPNGKWALFGCTADTDEQGVYDKKTLQLWDMEHKRVTRSFGFNGGDAYHFPLAVSPDGRRVVSHKLTLTMPRGFSLVVWETITGKEVLQLKGSYREGAMALSFTPDGKRILLGGSDGLACHEAATGNVVWQRRDAFASLTALAFSTDGTVAISASGGVSLCPDLWEIQDDCCFWQCRLLPEEK